MGFGSWRFKSSHPHSQIKGFWDHFRTTTRGELNDESTDLESGLETGLFPAMPKSKSQIDR